MGAHDYSTIALIALQSARAVVLCKMNWRLRPEVITHAQLFGSRSLATFPPCSRLLLDEEIVDRQSSTIQQYQCVDEQTGQLLGTDKRKVQGVGGIGRGHVCSRD